MIGGLDRKIKEMAGRIKDLREIVGLSVEEMAQKTDVSVDEYLKCESGEVDLNFAFIYRCAGALKVNVTDIAMIASHIKGIKSIDTEPVVKVSVASKPSDTTVTLQMVDETVTDDETE